MRIEEFKDIHVIDDGYIPLEAKYKEFEYCMPLCNEDGLFIELGVWQAKSLNHMAQLRPETHFYGFDTFEGVDEIWETGDKTVDMRFFTMRDHALVDPNTGLPSVEDNVTLIKGMFQDTLEEWLKDHAGPISFINMDPDIYSATSYSLDILNDRIVPGTIIRFDELSDWRYLKWFDWEKAGKHSIKYYTTWDEGEWKALNEWLVKYDRKVEPLWRNWHQSAGVRVIK